MGDQKSDDWLPDGWRVEVKVRKNGKKDKWYFSPSNGPKFFSKVEVCRYLNIDHHESDGKEKDDSKQSEKNVKEKGHSKQSEKNVVMEKVTAEGLPPGWIKELKVTKKGCKVRRDPYYTDPVSGYVFRSMRDALRYLETGEVGRLAFKPKDNDNNDVNFENDKICSPTPTKKQRLEVSGTRREFTSQSSELQEMAKDEQILNDSASTGECKSLSECTSDKCGVGAEMCGSNLPEAGASEHVEGGKDLDESVIVSAPVVEELPDKQSLESGIKTDEKKRRNSKKKKELSMPRRASKRLAGLALDPTPELKTSNRTRQAAGKQSGEPEVECTFDTCKSRELLESSKSKHPAGDLATPNDHAGEVDTENMSDKKQASTIVLPMVKIATPEEHAANVETDNKVDEKSRPPFNLPLMDLWTDPCIAFAIKTLTGISFDTSKSTEVSPMSNNSEYHSGVLSTPEGHSKKEETENDSDKKPGCTVVLPLANLASAEEHAGKIESSDKTDERPGSPLDMPFADIWTDPCIEFAIKTLTGAIPVGFDMDNQDYFQQQLSSSQTQVSSGLTLPDVGLDNFCQTEFLCQQFDAAEKPGSKGQLLLEPGFNHSGNVSLQNSGGPVFHQHGKERCQR